MCTNFRQFTENQESFFCLFLDDFMVTSKFFSTLLSEFKKNVET